jgi:hypothetical protein
MSIEERKEALRKEYVIWSRKVTSSDENTRKQAEEMLKVISEERAKLRKEQIS